MIRVVIALAALLCLAGYSLAADEPESHTKTCALAPNIEWCEASRAEFIRQYPMAFDRDYQSQRNVAFCFSTGCDGAVVIKKPLGCAWRIIILAGGSVQADTTDDFAHEVYCGPQQVDDRGFATAVRQARALFQEIYGEPLPKAFERR